MQGLMLSLLVQCQQGLENNINGVNATQLNDQLTESLYQRLSAVTSHLIHSEIARRATFCITNPEDDWNRAFNFSDNLDFLSNCILTTQGVSPPFEAGNSFPFGVSTVLFCTQLTMLWRLIKQVICPRDCVLQQTSNSTSPISSAPQHPKTFLNPNRNCNLTAWVSGCEPGWACSAGFNQPLDFTESDEIPPRTDDCKPCCEGFFCPQGLTCMIPCPLGSYCPLATYNGTTGLCDPYLYQLPSGKPNHTCGGANIWADVSRGCYKLTSCDANTTRQNITQYGLMLIPLFFLRRLLPLLSSPTVVFFTPWPFGFFTPVCDQCGGGATSGCVGCVVGGREKFFSSGQGSLSRLSKTFWFPLSV
ncbi:UNVERIFIED_CONTAM: ABC transporter G family member 24 [Sesamum radiatum]|uniref:ABC transporter G family member 24 n=1 Tax=Sesamum radiatum TaxID=300843 RepID=A0AAW2NAX6_SESRA